MTDREEIRTPLFGAALKAHRRRAGLTQEQLGAAAGFSVDHIKKIERGARQPLPGTAEALFAALQLDDAEQAEMRALIPQRARRLHSGRVRCTTSLPVQLTSFVGRENVLEDLWRLLSLPATHLVTLTGPPGVGKTRLAVETAATIGAQFEDGVCFVDLQPVRDVAAVLPATSRALGIDHDGGEALHSLTTFLAGRHLLLLLDNFEHLREAAPRLQPLLAACPTLKVLVTSRAVLGLSCEEVFSVPPLSLPDLGGRPVDGAGPLSESEKLFSERAHSASGRFAIDSENAEAVATICRLLEGLPLSIELAASHVRMHRPADMLRRLQEGHGGRLGLLDSHGQGEAMHHATLRDTLAWSYDLLTEDAQRVLALLSVFANGFTLAAAQSVCGDPVMVSEAVETLVDSSLLQLSKGRAGTRYSMLETVREFVPTQGTGEERENAAEAHATYFLGLAQSIAGDPYGREAWRALDVLDDARENFKQAVAHFLRTGRRPEASRMAGLIGLLWGMRGPLAQGRSILESVVASRAEEDAATDAQALFRAGRLALRQGEYATATNFLARALDMAPTSGIATLQARVMLCRGCVSAERGLFGEADDWFGQAWSAALSAHDECTEADAIAHRGMIDFVSGRLGEGLELCEEALQTFRAHGDEHGAARVILNMGEANRLSGGLETARMQLEQALGTFVRIGDRIRAAQCELSLGRIACLHDCADGSGALLLRGLSTALELGDWREAILSLPYVAVMSSRGGDDDHAVAFWNVFRDAVRSGAVFLEPLDALEVDRLVDPGWPRLEPASIDTWGSSGQNEAIRAVRMILPSTAGHRLALAS